MEEDLASLGLRELRRIAGGWQSLAVYEARLDGQRVAVKALDSRLTDRGDLRVRLDVLSSLATTSDIVCAPVTAGGRLVNEVQAGEADPVHVVAYEFAEGDPPDIRQPDDGAHMGRVLAEVHASLAALRPCDLPALAAFPPRSDGPRQLLHGDFSSKNLRVAGARWRLFDFDDCGYGPIELDLANSLYFVLFDSLTGSDHDDYRRFRASFLAGYRDRSGTVPTDAVLDRLITRRVLALASWLAEPDTAPPGVRTASEEWRTTLRGFVRRYLGTVT